MLSPDVVQLVWSALAVAEEHADAVEEPGLGVMEQLVLWAGFLGAWLLVAGPLHQARLELAEEELEREAFGPAVAALGPAPAISAWWWLFPPARLYLGHRAKEEFQRRLWLTLPDEQFEALSSFLSKARGWLLVGAGGFLIATKETFELVEGQEWPTWLFWVLVVVMAGLCVGITAGQAAREAGISRARAERPAAATPVPDDPT